MKRWLQAYKKEWESDPVCSGWLTESKRSAGMAFCSLCTKDLSYKTGGLRTLRTHATSREHVARVQQKNSGWKGTIKASFAPKQENAVSVAATNAVLKLAFFFAEHDVALAVSDHLTPLLPILFPDSKIASAVSAGRTKMTAAVHTVADSMHAHLVSQMKIGFFSIVPDESTDISVFEQVAVSARVIDTTDGLVKSYSLGIKPVPSASATNIFGKIEEMFKDDGIPWRNMIAYGSDGANVMRGSKNSVLTRLKNVQPYLYSIHCTCHQLHLCAQGASKCIPPIVEDFARNVAYFFEKSAKRVARYKEFQAAANVPSHKLIKPSSTRWLSLHQSVSRVLEQWDALEQYFTQDNDVRNVSKVKEWVELMAAKCTKAYLYFLKEVLPIFTTVNCRYQTSNVMIHKLYDDQRQLLKILLLNCIKQSSISQTTDCLTLDLDNEALWIDVIDLVISKDCEAIVADMSHFERSAFLTVCRDFYLVAAKEVKRRLPLSCPVLSALRFLCPERGKERSAREIGHLASQFSNVVLPENITKLQREWQRYQTESTSSRSSLPLAIDKHWHELIKRSDASGCQEFPLLSCFASAMLVIPHSSADIERNFSNMGSDKSNTRNSIGTPLLNSLMTIGCNKGQMTCLTFTPTPSMRRELPQHVAKAAGRAKNTKSAATNRSTGVNQEAACAKTPVLVCQSESSAHNPCPMQDLKEPVIQFQTKRRSSSVTKHPPFSRKRPSTSAIHTHPATTASKMSKRGDTPTAHNASSPKVNAFEFLQSQLLHHNENLDSKEIWTYRGSEYLLAPSLCQSRIDGRDGSNACTVIAAQVCQLILLQKDSFLLPPETSFLEETLVNAMRAGNATYDQMGLKGFLSAYDVVSMEPSPTLLASEDYFIRPGCWQGLVDFVSGRLRSFTDDKVVAGVLVVSPYSFAVCYLQEHSLFIVFDSHSHGNAGGLIGRVPKNFAAKYFEEFLGRHYAHLEFVPSSSNKVAQFTSLIVKDLW